MFKQYVKKHEIETIYWKLESRKCCPVKDPSVKEGAELEAWSPRPFSKPEKKLLITSVFFSESSTSESFMVVEDLTPVERVTSKVLKA